MSLELNLWFSAKSGKVYGNLNINRKEQVQNIDKLLSIEQFCAYTDKKQLMTTEQLSDFINDPDRDHAAFYAWTSGQTLIEWNTKNEYAFVTINSKREKLPVGSHKREYKGMPDIYFRSA